MSEIAERRSQRKDNTQALAVESALPGLLALVRWAPRRLSIEHYAHACDISYNQASRALRRMRARGLVSCVTTSTPFAGGGGVNMHGLTKKGHGLLSESTGCDLPWIKPTANVAHGATFNHDHMAMAAMIEAERDIDRRADFEVSRRLSETRSDETLGRYPTSDYLADKTTRIKWDASLTVAHENGDVMPYLIEIDMGSEQIIPTRTENDNSITTKLLRLSRYLAEQRFNHRLGGNSASFQVLFITTTHRRIDNIIARIDWNLFADPDAVFSFATHEEAIGRRKLSQTVRGNFWGRIWRSCSSEARHALLPSIDGRCAPVLEVVR